MLIRKILDNYFSYLDRGLCPDCKVILTEEGESWNCPSCKGHGHITIFRLQQILPPEEFAKRYGRFDYSWNDIAKMNDDSTEF